MSEKRIEELLKSLIPEIKKIKEDYCNSDRFKKIQIEFVEIEEEFQKGLITNEEQRTREEELSRQEEEEAIAELEKIDEINNLSTDEIIELFQSVSNDFFLNHGFDLSLKSYEDKESLYYLFDILYKKIENQPPNVFNNIISNRGFVSFMIHINSSCLLKIISKCDNEPAITTFLTEFLKTRSSNSVDYVVSEFLTSLISSERVSNEFVDWTIFESENSPFLLRNVVSAIDKSTTDNTRKRNMLLNNRIENMINEQNSDKKSSAYWNYSSALARACDNLHDCLDIIDKMQDNDGFNFIAFLISVKLTKDEMISLFFHEKVFDKIRDSIGFILGNSQMDFETLESILFDERVLSQNDLDVTKIFSNRQLTPEQLDKIISDDRMSFDNITDYNIHQMVSYIFTNPGYPIAKKKVFAKNSKSRAILDNDCLFCIIRDPRVPIEEANEIFLNKKFFYKMIGEYHEEYNNDPKAKKGPFKYDKYEYVKSLIEKNPYVVRTLSYSLLDDEILDMGSEFIDKISRDYDIASKFALKFNDRLCSPYLKNMIISIMNSRYKDNINIRDYIPRLIEAIAGFKMPTLGGRNILKTKLIRKIAEDRCLDLSSLSESNWRTLTEIALRDASSYNAFYTRTELGIVIEKADWRLNILPDVQSKEDLDNYEARRIEMCNNAFFEAVNNKDLDDAKNVYFNKYFSINIEEAREIGRLYASAPDEFGDDPKYRMQVKYVELLLRILKINKIDELVRSFNYPIIPITFDENIHIDRMIKDMYSKQISDSVYKVHGDTKKIKIGNKEVSVYEPEDDFIMLIHSTDAYGKLEIINDNYDDSWNKGTRSSNHGICCSLIANDNMGMAEVKDVLFGFDGWSPRAVSLMAPYDICSRNDKYELQEYKELLFLTARGIINNTRYSHNEMVLEREELRQERRTREKSNIQPSYVIIYSDMTDEIKEKAIKCSEQMHIPIVYLDKEKIAQRECAKIDTKIEQLKSTTSIDEKIDLLKDILLMHENNRSGCKKNNPEYLESYFPTEKISDVIKLVIAGMKIACEDSKDFEAYYNQSMKLMSILDEEKQKYDTLSEASNRKNEMDLKVYVYENMLIEFINRELIKYSTPKLKVIMENEVDSDESLSQIISSLDKDDMSSKIDYIVQKGLYNEDSRHHNIGHIERVLFFSDLVGSEELKNEEGTIDKHAMDLLEKAALYHDCGRKSDIDDYEHGLRSSIVAEEQLRSEGYSIEDIAIIKTAIEYHELPDDEIRFEKICANNGIPHEMLESVKKIAICLKDADALDRTRFKYSSAGLNAYFLRTKKAKDSVKIAEQLNERYSKINRKMFEGECKKRKIEQTMSLVNEEEKRELV